MLLPLIYHYPRLTLLSTVAASGNPLCRGSQIYTRMRAHGAVYTRYPWIQTDKHACARPIDAHPAAHTESYKFIDTGKALALWQVGLSSPREDSPRQLVPAQREGENWVH